MRGLQRLLPALPVLMTTEQVQACQMARHISVQKTVKRIFPEAEAHEWEYVYRAIGDETTFDLVLTWLRVIALNEADGESWAELYNEAMDDSRLRDGDKDVLVELLLSMQDRSLRLALGENVITSAEAERAWPKLVAAFGEPSGLSTTEAL